MLVRRAASVLFSARRGNRQARDRGKTMLFRLAVPSSGPGHSPRHPALLAPHSGISLPSPAIAGTPDLSASAKALFPMLLRRSISLMVLLAALAFAGATTRAAPATDASGFISNLV